MRSELLGAMKNLQLQPLPAVLLVLLLTLEFLGLKFLPEQKEYIALVGTAAMSLTGAILVKRAEEPSEEAPKNGQQLP